jgi:hypothetical protein
MIDFLRVALRLLHCHLFLSFLNLFFQLLLRLILIDNFCDIFILNFTLFNLLLFNEFHLKVDDFLLTLFHILLNLSSNLVVILSVSAYYAVKYDFLLLKVQFHALNLVHYIFNLILTKPTKFFIFTLNLLCSHQTSS